MALLKDTDGLHRTSCGGLVAVGCKDAEVGSAKQEASEEIYGFCQRGHKIRWCETVDEMRQMIGCSDS